MLNTPMLSLQTKTISQSEIAKLLGVSPMAVSKRLKARPEFFAERRSSGGRPVNYYWRELVLADWGHAVSPEGKLIRYGGAEHRAALEKLNAADEEMKEIKIRKERADRAKPRVASAFEIRLKNRARQIYIKGGAKDGIKAAVEEAVYEYWAEIAPTLSKERSPEDFAWYFYNKRCMAHRESFIGYAVAEDWRGDWEKEHDVNGYNAKGPTVEYDYISLLSEAGNLGAGYGAGLVWVIDGSQFDAFVKKTVGGKEITTTIKYYAIIDGVTGFPLWISPLENGETAQAAAAALAGAAELYGAPKWGVVMDNGTAFKSKEVKNLIRSWYSPAELNRMANDELRLKLFHEQTEPYIYPLPRIPRFPFKARIEQEFKALSEFFKIHIAASYLSGTERGALSYELGSTPSYALKNAPQLEDAWRAFIKWIYGQHIHKMQTKRFKSLKGASKNGKYHTVAEAFVYLGGLPTSFYVNNQEPSATLIAARNLTIEKSETALLPSCAELSQKSAAYKAYAVAPEQNKHRIKAGRGFVRFSESGTSGLYHSPALDGSPINENVVAIINPANEKECFIFIEHNPKKRDDRVPSPDDVILLDVARSLKMELKADLDERPKVRATRLAIDKARDQRIAAALNGEKIKNQLCSNLEALEPSETTNEMKELRQTPALANKALQMGELEGEIFKEESQDAPDDLDLSFLNYL